MFYQSSAVASNESNQENDPGIHPRPVLIQERIHEKALEISTRYKRDESDLIDILEQVDTHQVYLHFQCSSLFQYGVERLKLSENVVYNLIAVMRKARVIPELKEAVREGKIHLSNAKRIVPVLNQENKEELLQKAANLSLRKLEKEIVKIKPELAVVERATYVTDTRVKLELSLTEAEMMKLRHVQNLLSQARSQNVSLEETLIEMTNLYLKHKDPVVKAKRVMIKKGFENEAKPSGEQVSRPVEQEKTTPSKSTANNSTLSNSHSAFKSNPKRSPIPAAVLHQVNLRDQKKCCFKTEKGNICGQARFTHIHHIKAVSEGGENLLENLITLCSTHHRWVHEHMSASFSSH